MNSWSPRNSIALIQIRIRRFLLYWFHVDHLVQMGCLPENSIHALVALTVDCIHFLLRWLQSSLDSSTNNQWSNRWETTITEVSESSSRILYSPVRKFRIVRLNARMAVGSDAREANSNCATSLASAEWSYNHSCERSVRDETSTNHISPNEQASLHFGDSDQDALDERKNAGTHS